MKCGMLINDYELNAVNDEVLDYLQDLVVSDYWEDYVEFCSGSVFSGCSFGDEIGSVAMDIIDCFPDLNLKYRSDSRLIFFGESLMLKFLINIDKDANYNELALKEFINPNGEVNFLPECLGTVVLDEVVLVSVYRRPYQRFVINEYPCLYSKIKSYFLDENVLLKDPEFPLGVVYVEQPLDCEGNCVGDFDYKDSLDDYVTSPNEDNSFLLDFSEWHENY